MKTIFRPNKRRSQRGAIAVEAAIMFSVLAVFITFPTLYWALYFYRYSSVLKAANDAALYLSTAPRLEMTTAGPNGDPAGLILAKNIITRELPDLDMSEVSIVCNYAQGVAQPTPATCTTASNLYSRRPLVGFVITITATYNDPLTGSDSGEKISTTATVPFVGD